MKIDSIKVDDNLYLKPWRTIYSVELFKLTDKNRKYLQPWLPWVPSVKIEQDSISYIVKANKEIANNKGLELGIWSYNKLVGCLGLHGLSQENRSGSLGYWLDQDHQGEGIMTRSIRALLDYLFTGFNLNRIVLEACIENIPSCAVAERLGFTKEGIARQSEFVNGRFLDYQVYSILKSEWK